ncbi:DEAD/DEAH box helicase family protein [Brugia malayi]|uniref:ATP-dependent RNA helicase n=1 Tax=Brugia malayi TaxID=6279 RepID=A0A4E9F3S6_BRUMA|nr:DEAD/DEAH box helicase family protein [Brugia malayi]CDQ03957.2 Bm4436, isoform a [Brugia malayi]VIO90745.1 DEAD/DEAH box helicase family protein [Brugia malayi]
MPKIVSGNGKWKMVNIPGECIIDENFTFLSSFEEYIPMPIGEHNDGKNAMKKKNAKKRKVTDALDKSETNDDHTLKTMNNKKGKELEKFNETVVTKQVSIAKSEGINGSIGFNNEEIDELHGKKGEIADMSGWINLYISNAVLKAIADMGFTEPTEIQKLVIPSAVRDRFDIIGAAETGSGKTLAFGVPVVEHLLANQSFLESSEQKKGIRALILAPTRELVMQIRNHIDALLKYTPFKVASIVGGLSLQKQERILKYVPEIVIATPGRLLALMTSAEADSCLSDWSHLQCLVVDETDRMIEKGHFEDLQHILDTLRKNTSKKLQTFVFSATLTYTHPASKKHGDVNADKIDTDGKISRLIEITGIRKEKHRIIDITGERGTAKTVVEARINCNNLLEKDTNLIYLLNRYGGRTLVFTNSVDASRRLHGILKKHKPVPLMLHAKMMQKKRLKNLEKFAKDSVLLATDVAARGLDIRDVQHVIHYQIPKTAELYIHRCGRTARATKEGLAILLIDSQDVFYYQRICRNLNREKEFPIFPLDSPELYAVLKKRVEVATAVEALDHRLKKMHSKQTWFEKAAASADLDLDGSGYKKNATAEMIEDLRKEKKALLTQLNRLLSQSLPAHYVHVKKTRYVTAEIASNYGKSSTQSAIASLTENMAHEELLKKKCRSVFVRHLNTSRKKRKEIKR